MHMTIAAMLQDHRILKCDQVLLLDGPQLETHLLSFLHLGEADHNKITHAVYTLTHSIGRNAAGQSRRRLERGNGRRDGDRGIDEEAESATRSRLSERFHRSTLKLSSSGQTSS